MLNAAAAGKATRFQWRGFDVAAAISGDQPPGTLPRSLANTMAALVADPSAPVTFTAQLALHYAFVASKPYAVVVSCAGWGWLVCRAAACARARASELCHACLPE